jgi:hypothetical protein
MTSTLDSTPVVIPPRPTNPFGLVYTRDSSFFQSSDLPKSGSIASSHSLLPGEPEISSFYKTPEEEKMKKDSTRKVELVSTSPARSY